MVELLTAMVLPNHCGYYYYARQEEYKNRQILIVYMSSIYSCFHFQSKVESLHYIIPSYQMKEFISW